MKALHIINGEFFAGAERVQDLLAIRLPEFGVDSEFVCLKNGSFKDKRKSRTPLTKVEMRSRVNLGVAARIASLFRSRAFSIVHAHTPRSALIGKAVAKKLGLPLVYHVHSPARKDTEDGFRNWINGTIEERVILPRASKIIAVSDSLRCYLLDRGVSADRIRVIPNGVPVPSRNSSWSPPTGEWIVGCAALFRPRKGAEVLIRAIANLRGSGLPARLRLIGGFETPEYELRIRNLVQELQIDRHVDFLGFTDDVVGEMSRLSVFALPSLYGEGMPMVLLEAMSVGLPIVASEIEGIPEVLSNGAGILVPAGDVESLADALRNYIANPTEAQTAARLSNLRHRDFYSDISMASSVSDLYRECVDRHAKRVRQT